MSLTINKRNRVLIWRLNVFIRVYKYVLLKLTRLKHVIGRSLNPIKYLST